MANSRRSGIASSNSGSIQPTLNAQQTLDNDTTQPKAKPRRSINGFSKNGKRMGRPPKKATSQPVTAANSPSTQENEAGERGRPTYHPLLFSDNNAFLWRQMMGTDLPTDIDDEGLLTFVAEPKPYTRPYRDDWMVWMAGGKDMPPLGTMVNDPELPPNDDPLGLIEEDLNEELEENVARALGVVEEDELIEAEDGSGDKSEEDEEPVAWPKQWSRKTGESDRQYLRRLNTWKQHLAKFVDASELSDLEDSYTGVFEIQALESPEDMAIVSLGIEHAEWEGPFSAEVEQMPMPRERLGLLNLSPCPTCMKPMTPAPGEGEIASCKRLDCPEVMAKMFAAQEKRRKANFETRKAMGISEEYDKRDDDSEPAAATSDVPDKGKRKRDEVSEDDLDGQSSGSMAMKARKTSAAGNGPINLRQLALIQAAKQAEDEAAQDPEPAQDGPASEAGGRRGGRGGGKGRGQGSRAGGRAGRGGRGTERVGRGSSRGRGTSAAQNGALRASSSTPTGATTAGSLNNTLAPAQTPPQAQERRQKRSRPSEEEHDGSAEAAKKVKVVAAADEPAAGVDSGGLDELESESEAE